MFSVLPPPPRYPNQAAYNAAVAAGQAAPMIETNNTLANPTGPEYQLLVAEGTYVLREDLQLATPPPHPSEPAIVNPNPLATTPQPASAGTKLSLFSLGTRASGHPIYKTSTNLSGLQSSIQEHPNEGGSSTDLATESSDAGVGSSLNGSSRPPISFKSAPAFGGGNALLAAAPVKDSSKRRKPKNNIAKSNSSFISRVIVNESLAKKLSERPIEGLFVFANINRAYQWLDMSATTNKQDHLTKILFTKGHCLCHDTNDITKGPGHIDLIMGFSTGEIIWYEPMSQKYTRLNKNGAINATPVAEIRWIPGSENLFLAAHMDGSLVVYDKEKEDSPFLAEENGYVNGYANGYANGNGASGINMQLYKSVHSKNQKTNPVAFWKLSNQRINAFAFSPDNRHLGVVSEDGSLRIIDYLSEKLLHIFPSYYGGLSCLCWSPDGKYILTGGQDDLVTIWSFAEATIVARCPGHQSFVTAVAFDPWRCDDKNYRFGSVGEDCRLLLWDFSVGMLHRPKALSVRHRGSVSSRFPNPLYKMESQTTGRPRADSNLSEEGEGAVKHEIAIRAHVPELPPVASKIIDDEPLCWLDFTEESIITSCKKGHIRTWDRPQEHPNASQVALGGIS